jgi:DNA polymerase-3 subunit delta'
MPFSDFHGNSGVVQNLRDMLARQRFPQAMILAGPSGSGKYTLSLMLAQAMNCLQPVTTDGLPDFCGQCSNCVRIAQSNDLAARFTEAVEAREGLRDADKKDTRIYVQTHPDVLVIPPDPPQLLVKVDQVRHVTETIYFRPSEAREKLYIFPEASFMKEAANSLLKVLEEPPDFATLLLLAENPGQLLPTIRSRCMTVSLAALPHADIEAYLAKHRPEWNARQRNLVARLSDGAVGRARTFDLEGYTAARNHALLLLSQGLKNSDHSELFKVTETYRAGAEGREKTDHLIRTIYSLLHDLLFLNSGSKEMVRNVDILPELQKLAAAADFDWITMAAERLADVERGMRRNLLRSLSLDALAGALEGA